MPRKARESFVIKVCHEGEIAEFSFMSNGRFPFYSDINGRIRRQWSISENIPIYWEQVLFFPSAESRNNIMFKRFICDAREYEAGQKPFVQRKFTNAALGFTVVLGTETFSQANIIKARHEGKEYIREFNNLGIEYDKLKSLSITDAEYIRQCQQKIKDATSAGNQEEADRWSLYLTLHQKANEANLTKLEACKSERSDISKKLDSPILDFPTLRTFLNAQDLLDAEEFQRTKRRLKWESEKSVSGPDVSPVPDPHFPPLEDIFSGLRRVPRPEPLPMRAFADAIPSARPAPTAQSTSPGPSHYDAYGQPIIPQQPSLACSLEAIATDFLPEDLRRHMGNFTPAINRLHNQLDAPYQRLWHARDVVQNAVRDLRNFPPQPPTGAERYRMETPRWVTRDEPNPPPGTYEPPLWDNPYMRAPYTSVPFAPRDPISNWIPDGSASANQQPAPVNPKPLPWTCEYRHEHISCDRCHRGIQGIRYKCKDCADYDLCSNCMLWNQISTTHPIEHTFNTIIHRDLERLLNKERTQDPTTPEEHPASCNICHKRIRGIRTKCTNCPDWDCCEACFPRINDVHRRHTLVKINLASDLIEPPFHLARSRVKHSNIICDMCENLVVGDRWKCVHPDCKDYDMCDDCHASPLNTHPREHPILKLSEPMDLKVLSRIRREMRRGDFRPGRSCDYGRREGEYRTLTRQEREKVMTTWQCRDHSTFWKCEESRIIWHESKMRTDPPAPLEYDFGDDIKQEEGASYPEAGPSNSTEIDRTLESTPPTVIDENAPGSHSDIIKCYMWPETLAICPTKPEEDQCIDPSIDTETPTINPSIDTETPHGSPVAEITTPSNDAIFIGVTDVTIPAGCSLPVGAEFTKTWSMKHLVSGHEYKFDQLRLVHESGGLLGEACNIKLAFTQDDIKTGEKVEVSIAGLKVPDLPEQQVVEQWRFRDVDGTAYGEPLRLRFTVENPSLQNSLCNSSFIMPPPDHSAPRPTETQIREPTQSSTSVASTPTTSQSYSSLVSLSTEPDEEFAIVNRVSSHQSNATTEVTDDALASEFDFVDESEDARSQI